MLGALEAGVRACALSLPGALQVLGIQGQLPHPHCLPLGTQGFQAEGREAASVSWTRRQPRGTVRRAGVCRPQDLRLNTDPRRQEWEILRKFREVGACRIMMPGSQLRSYSQSFFPRVGASVFSLPSGSVRTSHPFVSRMRCKERVPLLSLSSPGSLEREETVSWGI